ncbi:glycosyltransferase [bacterium SCSIO 12741]|nr:glycosyltransferase [bacterium SCSIO 12741]
MRIAYLSTFYPFRGGIAQFNASLYRAFEKEHEVKAFTFSRQYPDFLFPGKTQYVTDDDLADPIDSVEVLDSINPFSYLSTAKKIRQFNPDLLIMKYWMSFFGPSLGTVAGRMAPHTKVITILDNVIPHESRIIDKPFTNYFLKRNTGFIAMSGSVQDDLYSMAGNDAKCLRMDHPIYDHFGPREDTLASRQKLKLDPDKKTLLFFGFIRDYKGLDLLIEAFDQLDESYQLIIAGESYSSFDKYQQLIDTNRNKERIHLFNDYISDREIPAFFSAADVCILPYKSATQSGITYICYHFNLPILATDVGGLKDTIYDNKTGHIIKEPSAESLVGGIREFYERNPRIDYQQHIQDLKDEKSWKRFGEAIVDFSKTL